MMFELYRLDEPSVVVCSVRAANSRIALMNASYMAYKAGEPILCSQNLLTAVTPHGVLGVRAKDGEPQKPAIVRRSDDDFDEAPIRGRRRKEAVPA